MTLVLLWLGGGTRINVPCADWDTHGLNFPPAPREEAGSFLTTLFSCEVKGKGEGGGLKDVSGQTSKMKSLPLLQ